MTSPRRRRAFASWEEHLTAYVELASRVLERGPGGLGPAESDLLESLNWEQGQALLHYLEVSRGGRVRRRH